MPTTLDDIAERAGVSKTTVSRVLNNRNSLIPVSEETENKVKKIAKELNYRPNINARALSSNKSYMLGFIVDYMDPYYNEIIEGAEKISRKNKYNLILSISKDRSIDETVDILLNQSSIDGVIIGGTKKLIKEKQAIKKLTLSGISVVLVGHYIKDIPSVNVNNYKGGLLATNYLVELGHKNIGVITGPDTANRKDSFYRLKGYKEALKENSIKINENLIVGGNFTYQSGYSAMEKLLKQNNDIEAVFACEDQMALGAISAANELGYRIPDDISIIGFDDIVQAEYASPKLTTIRQPKVKMGACAANILMNMIEEKNIEEKYKFFPPDLIKRKSCRQR